MFASSLTSQWLAEASLQWPDLRFLSGSENLTFQQAQKRVEALVAWMQVTGLRKGDRILIALPNRVETVLLALAALRQGIIFSILSSQIQPAGLRRIVAQCEPKVVFIDTSLSHLSEACEGHLVVDVDDKDWCTVWNPTHFETPPVEIEPEDLAFLVFTSGSTGTPRGVMLSHANVAFVCPAIQARLRYQSTDRIGIFLPLAFDYSLYQVFYACLSGASLYLGQPEKVGPELPKILAREAITILPGVPTVFSALIKMQRYRPTSMPALRMVTNTGDHLPRAHIDELRALLPQSQVFPMFGLTECKRVSILQPEEYESHPESVGRPLDGTAVFAVNAEGLRLACGEIGELVIQGPHLAVGYWRADEESSKRFRLVEGVRTLFSGDQGSVDDQGFITFLSRSDFVIKHRGTRLSPAEVEEAACTVPQVVAAGCVKDDHRDLLCLFLTTQHDQLNEALVLQALAKRLERGKLPDRVIFLPELPRTANQKLDRKALRGLLTTV